MVLFYPNGRPVERRRPTIPSRPRLIATLISVLPDVQYPSDARVVAAIHHEFDPFMVPVFVRNVYRTTTGGTFTVGHHAAAAGYEASMLTREVEPWTFKVLQPCYGDLIRPNKMELHFYAKDPKTGKQNPNAFVPFEWNIYRFLLTARDNMTAEERRQFVAERDGTKENAKAIADADEQARYEERADAGWLSRKIESWDVDTVRRVEATGSDEPTAPTRPSVYLGRKVAATP